jgi:hypothetical protein
MTSNSKKLVATDIDLLVSMGFEQEASRIALGRTHGDVGQAVKLLNGTLLDSDEALGAWRGETKGDFEAGVNSKQSMGSANRALTKTPLYCSIGKHFVRDDGITFYQLNIIVKSGVKYRRYRRFSQFAAFKDALPYELIQNFNASFPLRGLETLLGIDVRKAALDEWIRELSLSETCMKNEEVAALLHDFVGFNPDTFDPIPEAEDSLSIENGFSTSSSLLSVHRPSAPSSSSRTSSAERDSSSSHVGPLVFASPTNGKASSRMKELSRVPLLSPNPCPFRRMSDLLPFKTPVSQKALEVGKEEASQDRGDNSRAQLEKDLKRDRLIVNKRRVNGADTSLDEIVGIVKDTISDVLVADKRPALADTSRSIQFVESILRRICRTESAYLTHVTFSEIVEEDAEEPVLVQPEATLAEPLRIVISLKHRAQEYKIGEGDYAIQIELEGSTVFRINDPLSDNLDTLLQVRCFFRKTIFGMPTIGSEGVELVAKDGKAWILYERERKTVSDDWKEK